MHGPALSAARGERTALSSQVHLRARAWPGGGRGGGDREALPLKWVSRPEPTPGSRGALPLGHKLWAGHQEGHSASGCWVANLPWGLSSSPLGQGGKLACFTHANTVMTN